MSKTQWKEIEKGTIPKFVSYKEWKQYLNEKYDKYSIEMLEEFVRYLNIRKCKRKGKKEFAQSIYSEFFALVCTTTFTLITVEIYGKVICQSGELFYLMAESTIKSFATVVVMVFVVVVVIKLMKDYVEHFVCEQFYDDYQEIIQEMIELKKKSLTVQE